MSGRAHIFMIPQHEAELAELLELLGTTEEKYGMSHAIQVSLDQLLELEATDQLTAEQVAYLKAVPDPPNYGHVHVFLRQVSINKLFKLLSKLEIQTHDYAFSHLMTTSFRWMLEQIKTSSANEKVVQEMKNVKPPKIVLHN